jgi:alpha/beta superfamily hydrolase
MARKIESFFIAGPAGRLEAILEEPEDVAPREACLVCHPHPQHGGTMHNKVVYRVAKGLRRAGGVVLRFNYRGVNLSEGGYAHGDGEREDARAALAVLKQRYPELPLTLGGFSFGSRIALQLGCAGVAARRVIAVGFPSVYKDRSYLNGCTIPKIFVQSTRDEFGPLAEWEPMIAEVPDPKEVHLIDARNHFFADALEQLEDLIAGLL